MSSGEMISSKTIHKGRDRRSLNHQTKCSANLPRHWRSRNICCDAMTEDPVRPQTNLSCLHFTKGDAVRGLGSTDLSTTAKEATPELLDSDQPGALQALFAPAHVTTTSTYGRLDRQRQRDRLAETDRQTHRINIETIQSLRIEIYPAIMTLKELPSVSSPETQAF